MKSLLLVLILLLSGLHTSAQISGNVKNEKSQNLSGASILLKKDSSSAIIAYAITDASGNFTLHTNSDLPKFLLEVTYISYGKYSEELESRNQFLAIKLEPSSEALKEVIVKSEILQQRGDTLSFAVSAFKGKEDRVIADVLRKIPGIQIMPSGQIKYQGKPIQKYYIEGLDLLEGKYNLANENLNVEAVSKIEILENHQPIKLLDSLEFSDRASLNIKLKKDITVSGTAELGVGATPILWQAKATPMLFTKKRQAIVSYQSNNTGKDLNREINDFSFSSMGYDFNMNEENWLSILKIAEPPFSQERWLDNNAHLGSVNYLSKLQNDIQLKTNISYLNDRQDRIGEKRTSFFTPGDTVRLSEVTSNHFFIEKIDGKVTLEKNTKNDYLKNQLEFKKTWNLDLGDLKTTERSIIQSNSSPYTAIQNRLDVLKPIGKQLIDFNSTIAYKKTDQSLKIQPGPFIELINDSVNYPSLVQNLIEKQVFLGHSAGIRKAFGSFTISPKIGYNYQKRILETSIRKEEIVTDRRFLNELDYKDSEAYLKNTLSFESNDEVWKIRLSSPLKYKSIQVDTFGAERSEINRLLFEPQLTLFKKVSANWEASISGELNYEFGDINRLFPGYVATNYRNIQRYESPILEQQNQNYRTRLTYRQPLFQFFANASYNYRRTDNNLLFTSSIAQNGQIVVGAISTDNISSAHVFNFDTSKFFSKIRSTLKFDSSLNLSSQDRVLNESIVQLENRSFNFGLSIDSEITEWLSINYNSSFTFSRLSIDAESLQNVNNTKHQLASYLFLKDIQYMDIEVEYYGNDFETNNNNYFLNIGYQYSIKNTGLDLNLSWNNILNTKEYVDIYASEFSYIENRYMLRPSQVLASIKFSF